MVNVLVVGATGFLGSAIAKEAASKGHKVTALVSSESQSKKKEDVQTLKSAGIEIATGSLESDTHELVNVLKNVEVVGITDHEPSAIKACNATSWYESISTFGAHGTIKEYITVICCRGLSSGATGVLDRTCLC